MKWYVTMVISYKEEPSQVRLETNRIGGSRSLEINIGGVENYFEMYGSRAYRVSDQHASTMSDKDMKWFRDYFRKRLPRSMKEYVIDRATDFFNDQVRVEDLDVEKVRKMVKDIASPKILRKELDRRCNTEPI